MSVTYQLPESSSKAAKYMRPPRLEPIEAMWRELQTVETLDGKFLSLQHNDLYLGWQALSTRHIYIREQYKQLMDISDEKVSKELFAMILRGARGKGKSIFLLYVLWRAARSEKLVIWHGETVPGDNVLVFQPDGQVLLRGKEEIVPKYLSKPTPRNWYLVDDSQPCATVNRTFVAASTDLKLDSFQLLMADNIFEMHTSAWTKEELLEAQERCSDFAEKAAQ